MEHLEGRPAQHKVTVLASEETVWPPAETVDGGIVTAPAYFAGSRLRYVALEVAWAGRWDRRTPRRDGPRTMGDRSAVGRLPWYR